MLYHYQAYNHERLAHILENQVIYFSNSNNLNDPWDCKPLYDKTTLDSSGEYERTVNWYVNNGRKYFPSIPEDEHQRRAQELRSNRSLLEWMLDEASREMDEAISNQYRIYCLSTIPNSTLMWAHYADSFNGICLEYSTNNDLFCAAFKVDYQEKYPSITVTADQFDAARHALLTKSTDWEYEDEFRLIATEHPMTHPDIPTSKHGLVQLPPYSLKSIILGPKIVTKDRELIYKLVQKSNYAIEIKEVVLTPNRYSFNIKNMKT